MNERECDEVYNRLADMVGKLALGWVVEQVAEQIRSGKTVQKEIETLKENRVAGVFLFTPDEYRSGLKKGPKATFPVTMKYEPQERLSLLIDALEQAIINTADMEHHLFDYFGTETEKWEGRIEFCSEEPNSQPKSISKRSGVSRLAGSKRLKELLDALRKEI